MTDTPALISDKPVKSAPASGGFFTIYKKGEGTIVRVCTLVGAGILGSLAAYLLVYRYGLVIFSTPGVSGQTWALASTGIFLAVFALFAYWITNRSANAQFLIETDSEIKRVTWTSRAELIGSTQVVVVFMILIALFLFFSDLIFGWMLYQIGVLRSNPLGF